MSDLFRDELVALFQSAPPEIQEQLNRLLENYREKQERLYKINSDSKIYRRLGTVHFGTIGYFIGRVIDEKIIKKSEYSASFEELLKVVKVGFSDIKKKMIGTEQIDPETIVLEKQHYENILKFIQFEVDQFDKEIDAHEVSEKNSGIFDHLVDSAEQELKPLGFGYIRGMFGLKTESERLNILREQNRAAEEQAIIERSQQGDKAHDGVKIIPSR